MYINSVHSVEAKEMAIKKPAEGRRAVKGLAHYNSLVSGWGVQDVRWVQYKYSYLRVFAKSLWKN